MTMPRYRVIDGQTLRHGDLIVYAGAVVELPAHVGNDPAVSGLLEPVDPPPVVPPPVVLLRPYRVKTGCVLPHGGVLVAAGALVNLPEHVAADPAVSGLIEPQELHAPDPPVVDPPIRSKRSI